MTLYEDVLGILRDDTRFTSEKGNVLATLLQGGDTGAGRMLAVTDGPHHTELRKLLLQAFAPRALEGVARRVRQAIRRLLTEAIERGQCDFAQDIASIIPLETICDLLDVPVGDRKEILTQTKAAERRKLRRSYNMVSDALNDVLGLDDRRLDARRAVPASGGDDPGQVMQRLRRENEDLRRLIKIYAESIRQLTLDHLELEAKLNAVVGVTTLVNRR